MQAYYKEGKEDMVPGALSRQCPCGEPLKLNLTEGEGGGKGQCINMPKGSIFLPWSKVFIKITIL